MIVRILFLISLLFASNALAGFWTDRWEELVSPFTTDAKYFLMGGTAVTLIMTSDPIEDSVGHNVQDETVDDKPLGSMSKVGDLSGQMIPNALYFGTMYALYKIYGDEDYYKKSALMFKSTLYSGLAANVLKNIVREPRPDVRTNRESFPSGHTTTAFAFASVVGTQHEWYWAVPAYGLATLVAFSRINDNRHWLHDVVGGAVLGTTYGLSLSYLMDERDKNNTSYRLSPYGNGAYASYSITF